MKMTMTIELTKAQVTEAAIKALNEGRLGVQNLVEIKISRRERDTILAALRVYQQWAEDGTVPMTPEECAAIRDIATNGGRYRGLLNVEIDDLCAKINV